MMKRVILLIATLLAALTLYGQQYGQQQPADLRDKALTTGEYEKEYTPDEIYVSIIIRERDSKGKVSIEEQQQAMMKALKEQGINTDDLKVKQMSTSYYKKGQNLAFGQYELKLSTPEEFFTVLALLDGLGISDTKLARIDRSDREQLRCEVAAQAMKNARTKAEVIAETEGRKIGSCIRFSDNTAIFIPDAAPRLEGMTAGIAVYGNRAADYKDFGVVPQIGTVKITAQVTAEFLLR